MDTTITVAEGWYIVGRDGETISIHVRTLAHMGGGGHTWLVNKLQIGIGVNEM